MPRAAATAVLPTPPAREPTPTMRPVGLDSASRVSSSGAHGPGGAALSMPAARSTSALRSSGDDRPPGPESGAGGRGQPDAGPADSAGRHGPGAGGRPSRRWNGVPAGAGAAAGPRTEEHTAELPPRLHPRFPLLTDKQNNRT